MSDTGVVVSMEWVRADDHLIASYVVENRLAAPVVVFDRLFLTTRDGSRMVEPDRAYVSVTSDGVLRIEKFVPALPVDRDVERPEVPYARAVPPGGRLEGRALVGVPVLTTPAYGPPTGSADNTRAGTAVFRLGYAVVDDVFSAIPIKDQEGVWSVPYGWAATRQQVWTGPLIEVDVGVVQPMPALP